MCVTLNCSVLTGIAAHYLAGRRVQHTVIGDAVNVASRLQTATKELGRPIVIAQSTFERIQSAIDCEPLEAIHVKGKQAALAVYAPIALRAAGAGTGTSR